MASHFGLGEFTTHFRNDFRGDWDVGVRDFDPQPNGPDSLGFDRFVLSFGSWDSKPWVPTFGFGALDQATSRASSHGSLGPGQKQLVEGLGEALLPRVSLARGRNQTDLQNQMATTFKEKPKGTNGFRVPKGDLKSQNKSCPSFLRLRTSGRGWLRKESVEAMGRSRISARFLSRIVTGLSASHQLGGLEPNRWFG